MGRAWGGGGGGHKAKPDATREEGVVIACHEGGAFDVRLDDGAFSRNAPPNNGSRYWSYGTRRATTSKSMDQLRFLRPRFSPDVKAPPEHAAFVSETDPKWRLDAGLRDPRSGAAGRPKGVLSTRCVWALPPIARHRRDAADHHGSTWASRFFGNS